MASKGSSTEEDNRSEVRGAQSGGQTRKGRHTFTNDELQILNQVFEQNPYPLFTTRAELANQIHCRVHVIDTWFKNRRAKRPPRERQRELVSMRRNQFPVQNSLFPVHQDTQAQTANSSNQQFSFPGQESPAGGGGNSLWETQRVPVGQVGLCDVLATGVNMKSSCASEYPGGSGSRPSGSTLATCVYPTISGLCFESAGFESGQGQHSTPFHSHYVFNEQGMGHQQEEQRLS